MASGNAARLDIQTDGGYRCIRKRSCLALVEQLNSAFRSLELRKATFARLAFIAHLVYTNDMRHSPRRSRPWKRSYLTSVICP